MLSLGWKGSRVLTGREGRGDTFTNWCPAFRQIEENRELFLYPASQLPSIQNNPYAEVVYFGVGYSATLQHLILKNNGKVKEQESPLISKGHDFTMCLYSKKWHSLSKEIQILQRKGLCMRKKSLLYLLQFFPLVFSLSSSDPSFCFSLLLHVTAPPFKLWPQCAQDPLSLYDTFYCDIIRNTCLVFIPSSWHRVPQSLVIS